MADLLELSALAGLVGSSLREQGVDVSWTGLKQALREGALRDPLDALAVTVLGGSFLFYLAEKDENPKVTSYVDALVFISTCLSVGYADVFARTVPGKAIATAVMTIGPALSGAALDGPRVKGEPSASAEESQLLAVARIIGVKLDAIVDELRAQRGNV